jgi:hypothetical protein
MAVRKGFENLDRRFLGQCGSASEKTKGLVGFGGFFAHGASLAGQHPGFQKQSNEYLWTPQLLLQEAKGNIHHSVTNLVEVLK